MVTALGRTAWRDEWLSWTPSPYSSDSDSDSSSNGGPSGPLRGAGREKSDSGSQRNSTRSEGGGSPSGRGTSEGGQRSGARDHAEERLRSRIRWIALIVFLGAFAAYVVVDLFGRLFRDGSFRTADPTIFGILIAAIAAFAGVGGLEWLGSIFGKRDDK